MKKFLFIPIVFIVISCFYLFKPANATCFNKLMGVENPTKIMGLPRENATYIMNIPLHGKVRYRIGQNTQLPHDEVLAALEPEFGGACNWVGLECTYETSGKFKDLPPLVSEHKIYGKVAAPAYHPDPVGMCEWYANESLTHSEIMGVFFDDLAWRLTQGPPNGWSAETVADMSATIRSINPALKIMVTYYPDYEDTFDFSPYDFDEIWFGLEFSYNLPDLNELLEAAYAKFPGKGVLAGCYPEGSFEEVPWTLNEFKTCLKQFRNHWEADNLIGVGIYCVGGNDVFLYENADFLAMAKAILNP